MLLPKMLTSFSDYSFTFAFKHEPQKKLECRKCFATAPEIRCLATFEYSIFSVHPRLPKLS